MGTGSIPPPNPLAYEGQVVVPYIIRTNPSGPTTAFNNFPVPTVWINPSTKKAWILVSVTLGVATWIQLSSGSAGPLLEIAVPHGTSPVSPDGTGLLTLTSNSGTITITGSTNSINFDLAGGGTAIDSFTTDVSGPVTPNASGNVALTGSSSTFTSGAVANTVRTEVQGINHAVFIGRGTNTAATTLSVGGTGFVLAGQTGADPIFTTAVESGNNVFTFYNTNAANQARLRIENQDNTAAGTNAAIQVVSGGTAGGCADLSLSKTGGRSWAVGMPNTTSEQLVIHTAATPFVSSASGTETWKMTTAGVRTMALQPAFLGRLGSTATNKTGNGATYTLGTDALTKDFDQGTNFTTGGVFTAPVTGIYDLRAMVTVVGTTIATTFVLSIVTTGRTFTETFTRAAGSTDQSLTLSVLALMSATNTATVTITVSGEAADTDDIKGGTACETYFSGALFC